MEHIHSHKIFSEPEISFKAGILINLLFVILELIFGLISNSMALVADSGHNFSDIITLVFSFVALKLSRRKPTMKFTYGFRRSTILAALVNTMLLIFAVGLILWETIGRIKNPVEINSLNVIVIAGIGIIVNGITVLLFRKGQKHDLNIRSAFVHFIADTLVSSGVVVSGVIIALTGFYWIDSVVSIVILLVIIYSTFSLLIVSVNLALDAVPENINFEEVRECLLNIPEVINLHDLHIWALSTTESALTVHLSTKVQTDINFINKIQKDLHQKFSIGHSTIQVEHGKSPEPYDNKCN